VSLVCRAQAADREGGRRIEFSSPRSDEVTTNLNQLRSKKDGLKQLEEDLYRPLQGFSPKSSLDGVVAPMPYRPAAPVIQSKRVKDLLERRKNWIFMRPEDLVAEPTVEDILKAPDYGMDGREKADPRSMEQYYRRSTSKRPAANRLGQLKDDELFGSVKKSNSGDEVGEKDDSSLPYGLKESAQALRSMFEPDKAGDLSAQGGTRSSFSDPFGLGENPQSKERMLEHKKFMDGFRSQMDPGWQPPARASSFDPVVGFAVAPQPMSSPAAGLSGSASPAPHHGLEAQNDVLHPMLGPAGLPDVNARALGQLRPELALPKVEAPKKFAPTFTAPRRAF
jgi:hypothetical protein